MPIEFHDLSFTYNLKSPLQSSALKHINLALEDHSFVAVVGRTGSGKSTLIQMINALLSPTSGYVDVNGFMNHPEKKEKIFILLFVFYWPKQILYLNIQIFGNFY